jgi:tRNA/tmRNA/rRNA uracil-C5-methylase (TrmA/RlmC/RlmD family)
MNENINRKDKIVKAVIDKYQERSEIGQEKYGTTLERNDLPMIAWMQHLQEELMDATLYLEKLKSDLTSRQDSNDSYVITKESWSSASKITKGGFIYVKFSDLKILK